VAPGAEPPRAVETRARAVVQGGRVEAEPRGAVVAEERAGGDSPVVAEPRPGGQAPANARHNIRRIYFPLEMICDNSGR
jgi:hypothetical protein